MLSSISGNLTLQANQQATPTAGDFAGVTVNNATIKSTGTGLVTIQGTGGTTGTAEHGVYVEKGAIVKGARKRLRSWEPAAPRRAIMLTE